MHTCPHERVIAIAFFRRLRRICVHTRQFFVAVFSRHPCSFSRISDIQIPGYRNARHACVVMPKTLKTPSLQDKKAPYLSHQAICVSRKLCMRTAHSSADVILLRARGHPFSPPLPPFTPPGVQLNAHDDDDSVHQGPRRQVRLPRQLRHLRVRLHAGMKQGWLSALSRRPGECGTM